jgi:hypothetical protein
MVAFLRFQGGDGLPDKSLAPPREVSRNVARAEEALVTDKAEARRLFKLYSGVLPKKRSGRSNLFVHKILPQVEVAAANLAASMFQYRPYFDLESRSGQNSARADNAEKVLQYNLETADFEAKCIPWIKSSAIESIAVAKLCWRKTVRNKRRRMPLSEAMMEVPNFKLPAELKGVHVLVSPDGSIQMHEGDMDDAELALLELQGVQMIGLDEAPAEVQQQFTVVADVPTVVYDGLDFESFDFGDCFWDPDASSVDKLRFAGHHFGATMKDLKGFKKSGVELKNLKALERWAQTSQIPDLSLYKKRQDLGKSEPVHYEETETVFKVTEYWSAQDQKLLWFVTTGTGGADQYEDAICIREEDHPYWHGDIPYHYLPYGVVPQQIIGMGIAKIGESLQNEYNDLRNIQQDGRVQAIMPPIGYNENVIDNPALLQNWEPNKLIPLDLESNQSINNVVHLFRPDAQAMQNTEYLLKTIENDMENATGVTKIAQGQPIQRRSTYSETALLKGSSDARFGLQIQVNDGVMKRIAKQALQLLDQYSDPQVEVRITGDDGNVAFETLDREDLSLEYDVYTASSSVESLASKMAQAQNIINAYGAIRGTSLEGYLRGPEFLREYFRLANSKDGARFIKTDAEIQQAQQAQAQAQGAQGAPQGQPEAPPDETQLIQQENQQLMQGQMPQVTPEQNHTLHYEGHAAMVQQVKESLMQQGMSEEQTAEHPVIVAASQHVEQHMTYSPELQQYLEGLNGQPGTDALAEPGGMGAGGPPTGYGGMEDVPIGY